MPVTHGVAGSSPVQTASKKESLSIFSEGFFICQWKRNKKGGL